MSTLIIIGHHYHHGINAVELAEFLLAYNAYGQQAAYVFTGKGLELLQPGPSSPFPALDKMLGALSYGDNPVYGIGDQHSQSKTSLELTWITDAQLEKLRDAHAFLLEYHG